MAGIGKLITFGNAKYKMCISEGLNALNVAERNPGPPPGFGGIDKDFLSAVVQSLGVNFDYYVSDTVGFGTLQNGNFTCCKGFLQRKQADVIMSLTYHLLPALTVADPTASYYEENYVFVSKIPDEVSKFDAIFKTYDISSFILIGLSLCIISLVFYFLTKGKYSYFEHLISRFADLVFQEPLVKIERSLPEEILTIFWSFGGQFLTLSFMAVLLTALLLPRSLPPVDNDEKLLKALKNKEYTAGIFKSLPNSLLIMEHSPIQNLREIGKFIRDNDWQLDLGYHNYVDMIQNNSVIATSFYHRNLLIPDSYPVIVFQDAASYTLRMCLYTSKSFPLKNKFKSSLQKIVESGIYQKTYGHYIFKFRLHMFRDFREKIKTVDEPLTMQNLLGAFLILAFGLSFSTVVFIYELLMGKFDKKFSRSQSNLP